MDLKLDKAEVTVMPCRDYEEQNLDGSFTKIVGNFLGLDVVFSENDDYLYSFIIQKKNWTELVFLMFQDTELQLD